MSRHQEVSAEQEMCNKSSQSLLILEHPSTVTWVTWRKLTLGNNLREFFYSSNRDDTEEGRSLQKIIICGNTFKKVSINSPGAPLAPGSRREAAVDRTMMALLLLTVTLSMEEGEGGDERANLRL